MWLVAASLSLVDGQLVEQPRRVFVAGMGASVHAGDRPEPAALPGSAW